MGQGSFARLAMVATALAGGLLVGAIGRADGPHGGAPLQIAPARPLQLGLLLDTQGKHPGTPPLDFHAWLQNNTTTAVTGEVMFGPPLSGKMVTLPPKPAADSRGPLVEVKFSDPGGLAPCATRDYSVQLQGKPEISTLRVTSSACTFAPTISDAWLQMSPDRQANSVYVDNPTFVSQPACAPVGHDFMTVRATVYNSSKVNAKGISVQLVPVNGAPIGGTPTFDLAANSAVTKTIAAGALATGKVEIKIVDPNHTIAGVLANVGVYVVLTPTCTIGAVELGALATAVRTP